MDGCDWSKLLIINQSWFGGCVIMIICLLEMFCCDMWLYSFLYYILCIVDWSLIVFSLLMYAMCVVIEYYTKYKTRFYFNVFQSTWDLKLNTVFTNDTISCCIDKSRTVAFEVESLIPYTRCRSHTGRYDNWSL